MRDLRHECSEAGKSTGTFDRSRPLLLHCARPQTLIRCCTVSARATEAGAGTGIRNQPGQWRALLATSSYRAQREMNQAPIRKRSVNSPPSLRTERANSSRSVGHAHSLLSFPRLRSLRQHQTLICKRLFIAPKHPEACRFFGQLTVTSPRRDPCSRQLNPC